MDRIISTSGSGSASAKPDLVTLSMVISGENRDYDKAYSQAVEKTNSLRKAIEDAGFSPGDIITTDLRVNTVNNSTIDSKGNYKQAPARYVCTHSLELKLKYDDKTLRTVLSVINGSEFCSRMNVNFSLSDMDGLVEEALLKAYTDAKKKAEVLLKAGGAALGEVVKIVCDASDMGVAPMAFGARAARLGNNGDMDINPENVEVYKSVTVTWQII